jgi:NAD(P)-dependent dehydrogenase (short-subunit alcohol dehydrogenase family)
VLPKLAQVNQTILWVSDDCKVGVNPVSQDAMYLFVNENAATPRRVASEGADQVLKALLAPFPDPLVQAMRAAITADAHILYRPIEQLLMPLPWHTQIDSLFDELFHINVKSNFLLARVFAEMLEAAKGAIVLTTSNAAYAADGGGAFYTASKGALRSLVGQLAFEFAPNVRVNAVAPAGIANSQLRGPEALGRAGESQADIPKDAFLEVFRKVSLLNELPTPEDHGAIYAFLASHDNKIMTGQTVIADQGLLNRGVLTG